MIDGNSDYINRERKIDEWTAAINDQAMRTSPSYREMLEIRDRERINDINRRIKINDLVASSIALTPEGGTLPDSQVKYLNDSIGISSDGKSVQNGQIMEGGFNPNTGGYGFVMAKVDSVGNVSYVPHEISREEMYGIMRNHQGMFGADQTAKIGSAIQDANVSYTNNRLDQLAMAYKSQVDALNSELVRIRSGRKDGGLNFDQRLALEKARQEGMDRRQKTKDAAVKDLAYIKSINKQMEGRKKAVNMDPNSSNFGKPMYTDEENNQWYDEQMGRMPSNMEYGEANSGDAQNENTPYVSRGMLSIPGVENWIAPNTEFEIDGKKYMWDGKQDGGLNKHVFEIK